MKLGLAPTLLIVFSLLASALAELQDGQDQHEQRSCVAKGGTCVKNLCQTPLAGGECEAGEMCCEIPENNNAESEAGETREKRGTGGSSGGNPSPDKGSGGTNADKGQGNGDKGQNQGGGNKNPVCRTAVSLCKTQGGICLELGSACQFTTIPIHQPKTCLGQACTCCVEEPACAANSYCSAEGGYCSDYCGKSDRVLEGICGSPECKCCAPPCRTMNSCFQKGGYCVTSESFCAGIITPECQGSGCMCCVNDIQGCIARAACGQNGGVCTQGECNVNETIIQNGCLGEGCRCCAPKPCSRSRVCNKRLKGQCVKPADCPSADPAVGNCADDCVCCVDCKKRTPCTRSFGYCTKGRCNRNEETIKGGCQGKKCRCCAPGNPCTRTGKQCTNQGGRCTARNQCTTFTNTRGCRSGTADCVCCLDP